MTRIVSIGPYDMTLFLFVTWMIVAFVSVCLTVLVWTAIARANKKRNERKLSKDYLTRSADLELMASSIMLSWRLVNTTKKTCCCNYCDGHTKDSERHIPSKAFPHDGECPVRVAELYYVRTQW